MSLEKFTDNVLNLSKTKKEIIMFFVIFFTIAIIIDLFIQHNDPNIGIIQLNSLRAVWYIGFMISFCAFGIKKVIEYINKQKYFNIIASLDSEHLEILKSFAIVDSDIAEIKNNYEYLANLEQVGFTINCISGLYEGNRRIINGNVYTDTMVKAKLENNEVLPYIKEYFKKKKNA